MTTAPAASAAAATSAAPPTIEEIEFVRLVKSLDLDELARFLDGRPNFNVNLVCDAFAPRPEQFASALYWLLVSSPDATDNLTWTEQSAEKDCLRLLVAHGADLQYRASKNGSSLIHIAGGTRTAVLIELGADVMAVDDGGDTALHTTARGAVVRSLRTLLAAGADVNARNFRGKTPVGVLAETVGPDALECLQLLLDAGADLLMPDKDGLSPLEALLANGEPDSDDEASLGVQRRRAARLMREYLLSWMGVRLAFARGVRSQVPRLAPDVSVEFSPPNRQSETRQLHRLLLSAGSEKFRGMFSANMRESASGIVVLDVPCDSAFDAMLKFIYCEPVEFDSFDAAADVARLADEYLVHDLKAYCDRWFCTLLSAENAVDCLLLAASANLRNLHSAARRYIVDNFDVISTTDKFIEDLLATAEGAALMKEVLHLRRLKIQRKGSNPPAVAKP